MRTDPSQFLPVMKKLYAVTICTVVVEVVYFYYNTWSTFNFLS